MPEDLMIQRSALILKYRQPFIDWVNSVVGEPGYAVTLQELSADDENVYLVSEIESPEEFEQYLVRNYDRIFANEIGNWCTDESCWPKVRSLGMFKKWFSIELHSMVYDLE